MRQAKTVLFVSGWIALTTFAFTATAQEIEKPPVQEISGKIAWVYDYEEAKRLSHDGDKPLFVVFRCER